MASLTGCGWVYLVLQDFGAQWHKDALNFLLQHATNNSGGEHFHSPPMAFQMKWMQTALPCAHTSGQTLETYALQLPLIPHRRERLPRPTRIILPCSRPMSYLQALVCLRWAIQLPWKSEGGQLVTQHEASSFTLHSLKCALLSAAAQLRLPEDSRRLQGHRRLSSALLYSRDNTIEALWVQSELTSAIRRLDRWLAPNRGTSLSGPTGSPPSHLQLQSLPPSLTRFLYHREVDNLLSTALDADEEALAVARAALESSEAESEEEPPEEQACSPDLSPCTQEPCALGIRACRAVHSRQLSTDSLWLAPQALLVPCASDSSRHAALQTQGVHGRAVLKSTDNLGTPFGGRRLSSAQVPVQCLPSALTVHIRSYPFFRSNRPQSIHC